MASSTTAAQILSISIALLASGGCATLSFFDIPELQSQPADRALPMLRWLFSRGSHTFPQASAISCAGFTYLAFNALPSGQATQILSYAVQGGKVSGYLAAAALSISIAPVTVFAMIPTNFTLIKKNEELGGRRSQRSAEQEGTQPKPHRSAEDSVNSKGVVEELTDLSSPQTKTGQSSSEEDDREVRELLGKFAQLNNVRAALIGAGGVVGLWTALAA